MNRRFSPDVYLGVEEIVDEAGRVVDHAVLMRRMPAERRLATLARQHLDVASCLRSVARVMATCHAGSVRSEVISSVATPAALRDLWERSLRELEAFVPRPLDGSMLTRVDELAHRYLDGRSALLAERIARGRIVDGHGDLLADDIFCLDDGPRILDCLEFDDRLRWGDVLLDVGFLAMDLERLGRTDLARDVPRLVPGVLRRNAPPLTGAPLHRVSSARPLQDRLSARWRRRPDRSDRLPGPMPTPSARRAGAVDRDRRPAGHREVDTRPRPR